MKSTKMKQGLDWKNLGFSYIETDTRFVARFKNGEWSKGEQVSNANITLSEGSTSLHYGQQCFEGLKAQTAPDGRVLLFRPNLNAERMRHTAERILMPEVPEELFIRGVMETVKANYAWIPPHGTGASLYIRPFFFGIGENLGLKPAPEYEFRVFVSPVGPYYQ